MGGRQQRQNLEQNKKQECYSPVSEFDYDEEDGFVVIDDELRARWDENQTKYVPLTPFQSAVSTARYSWKNLSLESIQGRLDSIGAAAANHLTTAVTGLTQQAAAEPSTPAPRAQKPFLQGFEDWGQETPSPQNSLWVEREEELGSIFEQGEQQVDPDDVSVQWQRQVRGEGSKNLKQRIRAEWHDKEERGTRQVKVYAEAHAGAGSSIPPKHTNLSQRKKDRDERKRIDQRARDEFHQKGKHRDSAAQ